MTGTEGREGENDQLVECEACGCEDNIDHMRMTDDGYYCRACAYDIEG